MTSPSYTGVFDLPKEPSETDLLRFAQREAQIETRTSTMGKVLSFDPSTCTAAISVEIPQIVRVPNTTKHTLGKPFIVARMPVYFPADQNGKILTWPILPGQTGEIHVQDRDPAQWLKSGAYTDPISRATHWLSFGVFHPGIAPSPVTQAHGPVDLTATVLNGSSQVKLGKNAVLGVARQTDEVSADATMQAWIVQVQAALVVLNGLIPFPLPAPPSDFGLITGGSTKVKAE